MPKTNLLITRPDHSAHQFVARIDPQALALVNVVMSPVLEIVPVTGSVDLDPVSGVIFTSSNGVRGAPGGKGIPAYCVGRLTTQTALAHGWQAQHLGDTAQALIASLKMLQPTGPLLHLAGRHTRGGISAALTAGGIMTREQTIYEQNLMPLNGAARAALQNATILPVFSPRTAEHLALQLPELNCVAIIALSTQVAAPLQHHKTAALHVLAAPRGDLMVKAVENLCLGNTLA